MIKFGQLPFSLKTPQFDKKNALLIGGAVITLGIAIGALKLYIDLQSSQTNLARMTTQFNELNKSITAMKDDLKIERENRAKDLVDIQAASEGRISAFAKQAAACDEIKRKLNIQ